jgi:hypothetical protein
VSSDGRQLGQSTWGGDDIRRRCGAGPGDGRAGRQDHECGHGVDTRPPFDLARQWQRRHGYSPAIGAAVRVFVSNLPKATAYRPIQHPMAVLKPSADHLERVGSDPAALARARPDRRVKLTAQ